MAGFDKIQITRDTKANIVNNLDKLNEFELVIATDEKKLYAKIQGKLEDLSGLVQSDIVNDLNGGSMPVSADVAKQLNEEINVVGNATTKAQQTADKKVSKSGDTMTGQLVVPRGIGITTNKDTAYDRGYSAGISNESGYAMLWRLNDDPNKANEFIGIDKSGNLIYRKATGGGKTKYTDANVYNDLNCLFLKSRNGAWKTPSGFLIQWGTIYKPMSGSIVYNQVRFPVTFTQIPVIVTGEIPNRTNRGNSFAWAERPDTLNYYANYAGSPAESSDIQWIAIGV